MTTVPQQNSTVGSDESTDGFSSSAAPGGHPIAQIATAIAAVMQEVDIVAKRGQNTFHRYSYARMEDVLRQLTPLLGKHGIVILQDEVGRSMFDDDAVIAVTYQFTVAHQSGEVWPDKMRQTGASRCRDSKGGWDDKSVNKCHTAARKYFLLSLFQIPTTEAEDADRVSPRKASSPAVDTVEERKIKGWMTQFLSGLRRTTNEQALEQWIAKNHVGLDKLTEIAPDQSKVATDAITRRRNELAPTRKSLPPIVRSSQSQAPVTNGRDPVKS